MGEEDKQINNLDSEGRIAQCDGVRGRQRKGGSEEELPEDPPISQEKKSLIAENMAAHRCVHQYLFVE